jgi:hypothetical protein
MGSSADRVCIWRYFVCNDRSEDTECADEACEVCGALNGQADTPAATQHTFRWPNRPLVLRAACRVAHVGCRMLHVACNRMLAMLLTLAVFHDAMFWLNAAA